MERKAYEFISKMMNDPIVEWKISKWTGEEFPIFKGDKDLLEKISTKIAGKTYAFPLPNLDRKSREIKRAMRRNDRKLYKAVCAITKKNIITFYHPDIEAKIVEFNERYKNVDNTDVGQPYDFTKSFTQQFSELFSKTVKENVLNVGLSENSTYTHNMGGAKNCYMVFDAGFCEDVMYSIRVLGPTKNSIDGFEIIESENTYDCMTVRKSNTIFYSQDVHNCSYGALLYNCTGCTNCIACANLMNKEYYIYNQPVSKEEFQKTWKLLFDGKRTTFEEYYHRFNELLKQSPRKNINITNCENSLGNNITNCKNVFMSDDLYNLDNYRYSILSAKYGEAADCMDISGRGGNMSSCYELNCCGTDEQTSMYNCAFGSYMFRGVNHTQYSVNLPQNVEFGFGCTDIHDKKYCILNKQYTKEEYEQLLPKIIEHMQSTGERGEFFDTAISPFPYNDTIAMDYYPIKTVIYPDGTQKVISARGEGTVYIQEPEKIISSALLDFGGAEKIKITRRTKEQEVNVPEGMETINGKELPNNVHDMSDNIINKAIICEVSGRPFRIVKPELEFYRTHGIPLPTKHPDIRNEERLAKRAGRELYLRICDKCGIEILSVYPTNSEFKVYCESCFNKEIYG